MYAIAAAGTGGHVFPALAVANALVDQGVDADQILFFGGDRLEATAVPAAGFPFFAVEMKGWQRTLGKEFRQIPALVREAYQVIYQQMAERQVKSLLAMGGYITVPAGWAARKAGIEWVVCEQNAEVGLANRLMGRFATRALGAFPSTVGLKTEWVGNPVRAEIAGFDREKLRSQAITHYKLNPALPTLGIIGGSLGADSLNQAVLRLMNEEPRTEVQVLHLCGAEHYKQLAPDARRRSRWHLIGFEERMELFYAAVDFVLARAGGAVAELAVTGTPALLVPGQFGSGRHQFANARVLSDRGAVQVLKESELNRLSRFINDLLENPEKLDSMQSGMAELARPDAAVKVAEILLELHSQAGSSSKS